MNSRFIALLVTSAALAAALTGCGSKQDTASELDRAAGALQTSAAAEPTPAQVEETPPPDLGGTAPAAPMQAPATEMKTAIAAYKGGQLEDAVTRLQRLRAAPRLTPEQRIALNDAMAAVMSEVYAMAEKGDARAIQAVRQYEKMQTSRR